jgi:4-aminobutyrate aminotransferase-like enzyme
VWRQPPSKYSPARFIIEKVTRFNLQRFSTKIRGPEEEFEDYSGGGREDGATQPKETSMDQNFDAIREKFLRHVGQTSPFPLQIGVARAEGCYIYDFAGRAWLDFIAGVTVTNVGHCHPAVVEAVAGQARLYAHTMVYGEHIQAPQVELAAELARLAPAGLDCVYFLTTGAEANDAALKLAAKATGRSNFCAFRGAYHGDTVGAASCFGSEAFRQPYRQILLPVRFLPYNSCEEIEAIDETMAGVIVEPGQGEGGIVVPEREFLVALRERCTQVGALLIFDEVQTAFGRIGEWFAAHYFGVTPDVITVAKALGAGYPLAGVIGPRDLLYRFAAEPPFSHITTFGGHPVSCAAGLAGLRAMRDGHLLDNAREQGQFLRARLDELRGRTSVIEEIRGVGLMLGIRFASPALARRVVEQARQDGLLIETTLLDERVVRMSPPLIVTRAQCAQAFDIFAGAVQMVAQQDA